MEKIVEEFWTADAAEEYLDISLGAARSYKAIDKGVTHRPSFFSLICGARSKEANAGT